MCPASQTDRRRRSLISFSLLAALIFGAGMSLPNHDARAEAMSLRLNTTLFGWHSAFYLGVERGYFGDEHIELQINEGRGSADTVQLVAAGTDPLGLADPSVIIASVARGLPVKAVFSLINGSSFAVVSPANKPISTAADLKGKTFSVLSGSSPQQVFQAVLKSNGLVTQDVRLLTVDQATVLVSLLNGQVDAALVGIDALPDLEAKGFAYHVVRFAELGVNTPVIAIVTNIPTLTGKADTVRGFLRATRRSWLATIAEPDAAVAAVGRTKPSADPVALRKSLDAIIPLLSSVNTAGHPIGYGAAADWENALSLLKSFRGLQTDLPLSAFYTNDLLPN